MKLKLSSCLIIWLLSAPVFAESQWEDHGDIVSAAHQFIEQLPPVSKNQVRVEIKPAAIDGRIKLKRCSAPLEADLTNPDKRMGRVTVEVRCKDQSPWTYRLPVHVSIFAPVIVAGQPITRNKEINGADLSTEERDISKLYRGYFTDFEEIKGRIARQTIRTGTIITPNLTKARLLVKRGQIVDMRVKTSGYEIHMPGKALSNGSLGEVIKVENTSSSRILDARVIDYGQVSIAHH